MEKVEISRTRSTKLRRVECIRNLSKKSFKEKKIRATKICDK